MAGVFPCNPETQNKMHNAKQTLLSCKSLLSALKTKKKKRKRGRKRGFPRGLFSSLLVLQMLKTCFARKEIHAHRQEKVAVAVCRLNRCSPFACM